MQPDNAILWDADQLQQAQMVDPLLKAFLPNKELQHDAKCQALIISLHLIASLTLASFGEE